MSRKNPTSAKTIAGTLGTAVASIFWVLATSLWWKDVFSAEAVVTLTGSSAVVLGFVFAYFTNERDAYLEYACEGRDQLRGESREAGGVTSHT